MRITARQKDFLASIGVGLLSMILFVLLMGTVVLWGQSTGEKVRSKLTNEQSQAPSESSDSEESVSP
jgi:hypothetical protein